MAESPLAQDPRELFDVVTADGRPTGRTKTRAAVHRDGDWHRAVHVWVAGRAEGGSFLVFQRRAAGKDTWPGRLDATVGGHYRAGERLEQTLREVEEEIGIAATLGDLRPLGTRVCVNEAQPGIRDHELQDVFLLRDDRALVGYRPHPAELDALIRFSLPPLLDLLTGTTDAITGDGVAPDGERAGPTVVTIDDFIPTVDRYFYRVAIAAEHVLRGEAHVAV